MATTGPEIPTTVILPPQTAFQLGGESLRAVTTSLGAQPVMLTVVLLNVVFVCIAGYFLLRLESYRAANLTSIIDLVRACVLQTSPIASEEAKKAKELEALIEANRAEMDRNRAEIERLRKPAP